MLSSHKKVFDYANDTELVARTFIWCNSVFQMLLQKAVLSVNERLSILLET